jgi:hypothetical protein
MHALIHMSASQSFYHKWSKYCSSRPSVGEGTEYLDKRNRVILTHFYAGEMLVMSELYQFRMLAVNASSFPCWFLSKANFS